MPPGGDQCGPARGRKGGALVVHEVGVAGAEHLVAGLGQGLQADEVRHPAARHVDRGLRPEELNLDLGPLGRLI